MGRNAAHSAQIQAANRARTAAVRRLVARHQDEYDLLYLAEAELRGVTPRPRHKSVEKRLEEVRRSLQKRENLGGEEGNAAGA